jgi:hypothetical protein
MPELHNLYPGDELSLKNYPNLKQIIQLGHTSIRGVIKFKDSMVYANPQLSNYEIPENSASDVVFQAYANGKQVSSLTSGDLVNHSQRLWNTVFNKSGEQPVFISLDLETPLGLASFIANNANFQKVYIPSSFNMSKILHSLKTQESNLIVCDQELFQLEPPSSKQAEYAELTSSVNRVVVASSKKVTGSSLFKSVESTNIDPFSLQ